ncbi:response regulator [Alkalibaculum sp. M08DMB]|uniref:Stage 0 sporulation protein A homolog n=1 Tax=Alkalibaculum sporogenes TaxID=2655001 RepID=A0A6A7K5H6_9FIRM|nr:LytTR family DNA-binding domain-containing protein [Alkalibaculum sporogenes]MPW24517.1 response regulator [Alkalibaculum sporogenes]
MKSILVVEDELIVQQGIKKILLSIDSQLNIMTASYGSKALQIAKGNQILAFLIDIQLLDYNGLLLAEQIRELDRYKFTPIVFVTAIPTKEIIAYKQFHCYDYIIKPFTEEEIRQTMDPIIKHYMAPVESEKETLQLKQGEIIYNYRQQDIIYIESINRKLNITTTREVATFSKYTLNTIEKELSDNFIRCHKGIIINTYYIEKIDMKKMNIYVRNFDQPLPLGRKYVDELKGAYL